MVEENEPTDTEPVAKNLIEPETITPNVKIQKQAIEVIQEPNTRIEKPISKTPFIGIDARASNDIQELHIKDEIKDEIILPLPIVAEELVSESLSSKLDLSEADSLETDDLQSSEDQEFLLDELILEPKQEINETADFQPFLEPITINELEATPDHTELLSYIEEELAEYLEPLEGSEAEEAKTIISEIIVTTREIHDLDEADDEEQEIIKQELEELFVELLEYLGINYEPEVIKEFVKSFVVHELQDEGTTRNYGFTLDFLEEGTHEQNPGYLSVLRTLVDIARQSVSPLALLGRLALVRSVAGQGQT